MSVVPKAYISNSLTIEKVSFRDFLRGQGAADILKLWDKKSNKSKGLYISPEYAEDVLEIIEEKEKKKREKRRKSLASFAGLLGEVENPETSHKEMKASKYE